MSTRCAASQVGRRRSLGSFAGGFVRIVVLHAGFAGLALLALVQAEHQIVGWIVERDQLQMRLQGEARTGIERRDLVEGERRALGRCQMLQRRPIRCGPHRGQGDGGGRRIADCAASHSASFEPRLRSVNERLGCAVRYAMESASKARRPRRRAAPGKSSASAPSTRNQYCRL